MTTPFGSVGLLSVRSQTKSCKRGNAMIADWGFATGVCQKFTDNLRDYIETEVSRLGLGAVGPKIK
jgi:hypothetical protein